MEEYTSTRLAMQLISEDINNLLYHYHIGLENPEFQAVDYPPAIMDVFKQAQDSILMSMAYIERIEALISGQDTDDTFLDRLKDDLATVQSIQNIVKSIESLNERTVREVLEAELAELRAENAALEARAALLDEIPMAHTKIA